MIPTVFDISKFYDITHKIYNVFITRLGFIIFDQSEFIMLNIIFYKYTLKKLDKIPIKH